jgi:hypothetical protein
MLDHLDEPKPNQSLSYRETADVLLSGRHLTKRRAAHLDKRQARKPARSLRGTQPVRLHAFEQLGDGIVPWIYWVDDRGRLLVAVSGLEAYILESTGEEGQGR